MCWLDPFNIIYSNIIRTKLGSKNLVNIVVNDIIYSPRCRPESMASNQLLLAAKERKSNARLDVAVAVDAGSDVVDYPFSHIRLRSEISNIGDIILAQFIQRELIRFARHVIGLEVRTEHREARLQ